MIRPGDPYGERADPPSDAVEVSSDAEASRALAIARREGQPLPTLLLRGGDLHRTLGGGAAVRADATAASPLRLRVPVDLGVLLTDDEEWLFVAHTVLRSPLWSGPFVVAMNAQWCGPLDLGPRSHPADGLLDITEGSLPLRQRLVARNRARSGTHLPHPQLRTRRSPEHTVALERPVSAFIDGRRRLSLATATLSVEPAAFIAHL